MRKNDENTIIIKHSQGRGFVIWESLWLTRAHSTVSCLSRFDCGVMSATALTRRRWQQAEIDKREALEKTAPSSFCRYIKQFARTCQFSSISNSDINPPSTKRPAHQNVQLQGNSSFRWIRYDKITYSQFNLGSRFLGHAGSLHFKHANVRKCENRWGRSASWRIQR